MARQAPAVALHRHARSLEAGHRPHEELGRLGRAQRDRGEVDLARACGRAEHGGHERPEAIFRAGRQVAAETVALVEQLAAVGRAVRDLDEAQALGLDRGPQPVGEGPCAVERRGRPRQRVRVQVLFDLAFVAGFVQGTGVQAEVKRGERLPDEVMETLQPRMRQLLASADDVATAVLYAVTQPIHVNVAEIVVRPAKQLNL